MILILCSESGLLSLTKTTILSTKSTILRRNSAKKQWFLRVQKYLKSTRGKKVNRIRREKKVNHIRCWEKKSEPHSMLGKKSESPTRTENVAKVFSVVRMFSEELI